MYYTYTLKNGKDFKAWRTDLTDSNKVIDVYDENSREYKRSLREDETGKLFFTWNKEKFYLTDYKKITIEDLKKKIEADEWITDDELCQAIQNTGVDKVKFIVPMAVVDARVFGLVSIKVGEYLNKICHIVESFNRMVANNYKLDLYPDVPDENVTSHETYYTVDLVSALRSGRVQFA